MTFNLKFIIVVHLSLHMPADTRHVGRMRVPKVPFALQRPENYTITSRTFTSMKQIVAMKHRSVVA